MANKANISFWKEFVTVILHYPSTFIKYVRLENWYRLRKAIQHEPPAQIIRNFKNLLIRTKNAKPETIKNRIDTFVQSIKKTDKEPILFVTHEVTRTGAPLIVLKLAATMAKNHKVQPVFMVCKNEGDILEDFAEVAPTYALVHWNETALLKRELNYFVQQLSSIVGVQKVYVNSVESRDTLPFYHKNGIKKVISLVHEMGSYYPKNAWKVINDYSDKVVFPAQFVKKLALENTHFDEAKTLVRGQGLLKEEILDADKPTCRTQIRREFSIPKDSFIVLGCGTPIARKGIDIFVLTAISTLNAYTGDRPLYFIWLGDAPHNEHQLWAQRDIEQSGWAEHIRFIGSRADTIPYFVGSDVFFLTSRGDPFPCVVHEAMAAGMRVVGFEGATGAVEIPVIDAIPQYGDIAISSNILIDFLQKKPKPYFKQNTTDSKRFLSFSLYSEFVLNKIL